MKMPNVIAAAGGVRLFPDAPYAAIDSVLAPAAAEAALQFNASGLVVNQDGFNQGAWIDPTSEAPGSYQIRANSNSPDTPDGGTMDTWLPLTSNRRWFEQRVPPGQDVKTFTVDLRIGSGPVLATATCTLTAEVVL